MIFRQHCNYSLAYLPVFSAKNYYPVHTVSAYSDVVFVCFLRLSHAVDRSLKRRQVKPLAASLLDALDYDSSDDSDFEVGDASGKYGLCNV